ncbi:MAG: hypothetical protein OXN17_04020 [Candidatus Poribacteria bacterium]|nr:hypothetical protein [Candidatus Poribacteria bacterium]
MSINRFFKRKYTLMSRIRGVAFLCFILLMSGCGEEAIDKPTGGGVNEEGKTEQVVPISTPYYPTTLGSRWVYRNPDGSEWTREVAELEFVNRHDFLLFFRDSPPLEEKEVAGQFVFVKAPSYFVKSEGIVRPISLTELQFKIGKTVDIRYNIRKTVHGIFNGMEVNTRYGFVGTRDYKIHGLERSTFRLLATPLVPGKTWKALDIRFSAVHNSPSRTLSHSIEAHLEIWAKIGANRISIVTPAGTFEDCLEIHYQPAPFQIETTELEVSVNDGFGGAAEFPKVWKEIRKYVEAEIPKTAETEFLKAMPPVQSASLWLAPEVGPVKIKDSSGISELIAFDVKSGSGQWQAASSQ